MTQRFVLSRSRRALIAAGIAAACIAGGGMALAADPPAAPHGSMMEHWHMHGPFGRLHEDLKLSPQQSALWDAAVAKMHPDHAERERMKSEHEAFTLALMDPNFDPHQWAARADKMQAEMMAHHKAAQDAWLALWDSLDATQRTKVRAFLVMHMGHEHGHMPWMHHGEKDQHGDGPMHGGPMHGGPMHDGAMQDMPMHDGPSAGAR